ncbi:RWP-RK domain-containing protein, partial [Cephalotus follicularis]
FCRTLELPPLDSFFEFNNFNSLLPFQDPNQYIDQLKDFGDTSDGDIFFLDNSLPSLYEDNVVDVKPLNSLNIVSYGHVGNIPTTTHDEGQIASTRVVNSYQEKMKVVIRKRNRDSSTVALGFDDISKYFHVPITRAAKEMKVGLTVLKKRCRELNIMRWPHRKIKSLTSLKNNVKELGFTEETMMLEEHIRLLQQLPDMELNERTKKLRQAIFKANYKKKRALASHV